MFFNDYLALLFFSLLQPDFTDGLELAIRADCNEGFSRCSPKGAITSGAPAIGDSLSTLYVDLLDSINEVQKVERSIDYEGSVLSSRASGTICCINPRLFVALRGHKLIHKLGADGTECLLLQSYNIPFCYVRVSAEMSHIDLN